MRFDTANLGKKNDLTKILAKENEDNGLRNRVNFRGGGSQPFQGKMSIMQLCIYAFAFLSCMLIFSNYI